MSFDKYISSDSENYYVPLVDLMSGIVFILMVILSVELMNIKYPESQVVIPSELSAQQEPSSRKIDAVESFKKELVSSISLYLIQNKVENKISENHSSLMIKCPSIFEKESLSLNKKGKFIALKVSEAFNNYLFIKAQENEVFKKYLDYIGSISINIFTSQKDEAYNAAAAKSFSFYGYLVQLNSNFLTLANSYTQRLVRIDDVRTFPESLARDMQNSSSDTLLVNFDFFYPQDEKVLW